MALRIGRFAPSPTGPLHAGSLVAALGSWLDVRASGEQARWLVRIEDADTERCIDGMGEHILWQLAACGLVPDEAPTWQTRRTLLYQQALERLAGEGLAYPCACSRKDIERVLDAQGHRHERHAERVYPGTCRNGLRGKPARAWRFALDKLASLQGSPRVHWHDRRLGPQVQDVVHEVGDFVLRRADGPWAYQLAVVVDDAQQQVTDVVRGADLVDNTARQVMLQRALGLPTPDYLHLPLVLGADGHKLSKQNGAAAIDTQSTMAAMQALNDAARVLGLPPSRAGLPSEALREWLAPWRALYNPRP